MFKILTRLIIGALFIYSAIMKCEAGVPPRNEPSVYARVIGGHSWMHVGIVSFEFIAGLLLMFNKLPRLATPAVCMFLSLSTGMLAVELFQPSPKPCGCFGPLPPADVADIGRVTSLLWLGLVRNALLIAGSIYLMRQLGKPAVEVTHNSVLDPV